MCLKNFLIALEKSERLLSIERLDPSYRSYYGKNDFLDIPTTVKATRDVLNDLSRAVAISVDRFLEEGKIQVRYGH